MCKLTEILSFLQFSSLHEIQDRASIANLFPVDKRCGIYILQFSNSEVYAGQAFDVTRRYVQHSKIHSDIVSISFKQVQKSNLNNEERATIWELEQNGFLLRNIIFTSIPKGDSDLDFIMSFDEQQKWLNESTYQNFEGIRVKDEALRRKYQQRFIRFQRKTHADTAIAVLREYVNRGIPIPLKSELSFWSCSCLPSYSNPKITIYSRININWQEVFTAHEYDGELGFSFHMALSPLVEEFGESLDAMFIKFPDLECTDHFYEPGGHDQINLVVGDSKQAMRLIRDKNIIKSIKTFNLRLMQKGACMYSRYHCMDLADLLLTN